MKSAIPSDLLKLPEIYYGPEVEAELNNLYLGIDLKLAA